MTMSTLARRDLGVALLLALVPACAGPVAFHPEDQPTVADVRASREEVLEPVLRPGERLHLHALSGDVRVEVAEGPPRIVARLEARATDAAAAQAAVSVAQVVLRPADIGQEILLGAESDELDDVELHLGYRATVPPGTTLDVSVDEGDVRLEGALGAFRLSSGLGDVWVRDSGGEIDLQVGSGAVRVEDSTCGFLGIDCTHGEIRVANVTSERQRLSLVGGTLEVENCASGETQLVLDQADVRLEGLDGPLECELDTGELELLGGEPAARRIVSGFAPLTVRDAVGQLEARATFGQVRVLGFDGQLVAHSGYGPVEVRGRFDQLDAQSGSGPLRAVVAEGSVHEDAWRLHSNHGDVILTLPSAASARLEAVTVDGEIECAFPVIMDAGVVDGGRTLRGALNGGGALLDLATGAGNIRVLRQAAE